MLQASGYETAYVRKFHMGNHPQPHAGFDYWAALPGQGRYVDPILNINGETRTIKGHSGQITTDFAIEFISKKRDKPFAMILGFKEPHGPRVPPDHMKTLYADAKPVWPEVTDEDLRGKPKSIQGRKRGAHNDEGMREYWRCITPADEQIGRVLRALDESGKRENTVVIFMGDNGWMMGSHGRHGKIIPEDESIRVPLIIQAPAAMMKWTGPSPVLVSSIDLAPTWLDLAGIAPPLEWPGKSLLPLMKAPTPEIPYRDDVFCEFEDEDEE